jgi:exodeoxyribonuclease X
VKAFIFDTETTGYQENRGLIEVGYMEVVRLRPFEIGPSVVQRFNPGRPSTLGALATHHIADHELSGCPSPDQFVFPANMVYLIAHHSQFDFETLGSPQAIKQICTLALAREAWPNLDSHKLGALMYFLDPLNAKARLKEAHSTEADIQLCATLLERLVTELQLNSFETLWKASEEAKKIKSFTFGKYKGKTFAEVKAKDPSYIQWCIGPEGLGNDKEAIRQALIDFLGKV